MAAGDLRGGRVDAGEISPVIRIPYRRVLITPHVLPYFCSMIDNERFAGLLASVPVPLADKGAQSAQVDPSRSNRPGIAYLALFVLRKLGCRVDHAR